MARGQSVYQGAYTFPVQSTAAQSIQQGAQAQAQMYSSLGQAIGKAGSAYFEKKEEDKKVEFYANDPVILGIAFKGQPGGIPTDPKERRDAIRVILKGMGGVEGVENLKQRHRAEQRAQEGAARLERAEGRIIQMEEDAESYFKTLTERPGVTTTETKEVERIGGGTLGQYLPLGRKTAPPPGVDPSSVDVPFYEKELAKFEQAPQLGAEDIEFLERLQSGDPRDVNDIATFREVWGISGEGALSAEEIMQGLKTMPSLPRQDIAAFRAHLGLPPQPSYASRLMGGLGDAYQSASERLAKVRVPEIPFAEAETVTRPGQSLLARSTEMTGPAFLETWAERNPNATVGMMELARQTATGLPQREAEAPQVVSQDGMRYLIHPRTKEVIPGSISTTTGATPTFEQISEIEDRDTELTYALENIKRVMDIFKVDAEGKETGEVNKWLVGPGIMDKSRRALADIGLTGLDSEELLDNRDYLKQFATRTALEASQMLKGSLSEGELDLLMSAAPKMGSTSSEWRRYIVKLNRMINTEKLKNDRLRGASSGGASRRINPSRNKNLTSAQIIKDVKINADWENRSPREKRDILKKVSARQDSSPDIIAKAVRILEEGLPEEPPPANGEGGADVMDIAAQIGTGEEAQEFKMTVPTVRGLKSGKLGEEDYAKFIEVLSSVMREAIETGAIPKDEFAGPDNVWYKEFPDPLRQENYEKLIIYAKESLNKLGPRAAARNIGAFPDPTADSLFEYLEEFAATLGG